MHDDLFFIAMIDAALDQQDRPASLREAFEQIRQMGRQRRYRQGYRQFIHWMQQVAKARQAVESMREETAVLDRPASIELLIEHDQTLIASVWLDMRGRSIVHGIAPGSYRFRLDTGCTLWEGFISEQGGFASRPEPGRPLRMAAATTRPEAPRTEIRLFHGELVLRLRPEAPAWSVEVLFASPEA